jgi:SAM-dependent methyltransferase
MTLAVVRPTQDPVLEEVRRFYEENHDGIEKARRARRYFYKTLTRVVQARIPPGQRVLDIGCGSGHLLSALGASQGVGIDVSEPALAEARERYGGGNLEFVQGDACVPGLSAKVQGPFDVVLLVNVVTQLGDVQAVLENLHAVSHSRTRVFIYSYSRLWQPLIRLAEMLHLKHQPPPEAWLPPEEIRNMLSLADFEVVRHDYHIVLPAYVPLLSDFVNRFVGHLPVAEWLALMYGIVARPAPHRFARWDESSSRPTGVRAPGFTPGASRPTGVRGRSHEVAGAPEARAPGFTPGASRPTVSVVVPCRNEAGHIPSLVQRLPDLPPGSEFLFVEGNSSDDTEQAIRRAIDENPERPLRLLKQTGKGKGDAVRLGFSEARGDVLLILDSDMGVAPEDVPKFVEALARGKGEMVNGSRMVYPMEGRAMRFLNLLANKVFAWLFSWLLGQQVRDTLCGTKAMFRQDYERIAAHRSYFGDFDPFGDFDLLFGASRLNLRIVDVAIRYHERQYGTTNISRFRHGWLLLQMSAFAARKLKFV